MPHRIDDAMIEVIAKLNSITHHLRKYNFEDSANKISKNTHDIVSVFTDAVVKFGDDEMNMDDASSRPSSEQSSESTSGNFSGDLAVKMLGNEYKQAIEAARRTHGQNNAAVTQLPIRQAQSWARVAATGPVNGGPSNGEQSNGGPSNGGGVVPTQPRRMTHVEPQHATLSQPMVPTGTIQPIETEEQKAASVMVTGDFVLGSLNHITSKIREGPLFAVEIAYNQGFAEIIFQRAAHALALVDNDAELVQKLGHGRFGPGYALVCTELFDWDEEMRQMENRPKERRRLTFARAGLLGGQLTFKKFQADVISAVGADGIDLIWAFNSGNVTAVFKSVHVAREVHRQFNARASYPGPYKGVQVTFSTDPCEKQLILGSQGAVPAGYAQTTPKPGIFRRR